MENCIIKNENGAFYRLGTNNVNSWTNHYDRALLMSEDGAKKIARKTDRAKAVIRDYTTINPDGITQGITVLDLSKRNIQQSLYDGKFCSVPGDIYTIRSTPGMICNSIAVHVANDGTLNDAAILTDEYLTLPNKLDAWKFLKQLSEIGGRLVKHQRGNEIPVDYKDSAPYKCRF